MFPEREGPYRYTIVRNGHSAVGVVTMYSKKTCASPIPDALPKMRLLLDCCCICKTPFTDRTIAKGSI